MDKRQNSHVYPLHVFWNLPEKSGQIPFRTDLSTLPSENESDAFQETFNVNLCLDIFGFILAHDEAVLHGKFHRLLDDLGS